MWVSKIGITAKPLLLGLSDENGLVNFASLSGPGGSGAPQLRLRRPDQDPTDAISFDVTAYTDPNTPAQFNAQRQWTTADFGAGKIEIPAGDRSVTYYAEVDGQFAGEEITFPDNGYFEIRFLAGIN